MECQRPCSGISYPFVLGPHHLTQKSLVPCARRGHQMSHFTLLSGKPTDSVTSRCPVCLKVVYYSCNTPSYLTDEDICCSLDHQIRYQTALWALYSRIQAWYRRQNLPFVGSMAQIEHYFRHDGGLDTVDKTYWRRQNLA
jgi:hypothetical protein